MKLLYDELIDRAKEKEEKEAKKRQRLADDFTELLHAYKVWQSYIVIYNILLCSCWIMYLCVMFTEIFVYSSSAITYPFQKRKRKEYVSSSLTIRSHQTIISRC